MTPQQIEINFNKDPVTKILITGGDESACRRDILQLCYNLTSNQVIENLPRAGHIKSSLNLLTAEVPLDTVQEQGIPRETLENIVPDAIEAIPDYGSFSESVIFVSDHSGKDMDDTNITLPRGSSELSDSNYGTLLDSIEVCAKEDNAVCDLTDAHYGEIKAKRPNWDHKKAFGAMKQNSEQAKLCRMVSLRDVRFNGVANRAGYTKARMDAYLIQSRGEKNRIPCSRCRKGKTAFKDNECVSIAVDLFGGHRGACGGCVWQGKKCSYYQARHTSAVSRVSNSDDLMEEEDD